MNTSLMIMILGMALVTYVPQVLPSLIMEKIVLPKKVEKFLTMIPCTAMAALIFPGILSVDTAHREIGVFGGLIAAILAWKKVPVILCVIAAIALDVLLYMTVIPHG
ncbi:MAG: AzlD domain-containing protein [Acidaminococcus sp.]|jgi:branched-subunit amino acid transport protein|nr:AzlD domain-containing protein [Acidaminococcus sp.]MCI2099645.1 AzlD domain-containing protein [Acidaminococcus sp.]MCI2113730.1 AzlD domain-containing protein [Acidaminococcus sp.]MCI2115813.1 AzlD domain-containing protein [Acidaminococcus sp.]